MDPIQKLWMYENWVADQVDDTELAKNHAYLLGSFWNPEAVQKLTGGGNTTELSDEEFEESTRMILREKEEENKKKVNGRRRRRGKISKD